MPRKTNDRGYDAKHKAERERWRPRVAAGLEHCRRCGQRITPGQAWDLGHTDDRRGWTGPEHATCNRAAGARKRNANARARRARGITVELVKPTTRPEREW